MRLLKKAKCFISFSVSVGFFFLTSSNCAAFFAEHIDIKPHATLRQAFDDNVTFANENEKEDFVTTLSAGLTAAHEGKTQSFKIMGDIKQQLFARDTGFNNISQALVMNFMKEFSKYTRVQLTNTFTHSEEPSSFEDNFGRTSGRYCYYRNIFDAVYAWDMSKHIMVQGHYGNESYHASKEEIKGTLLHRLGFDINYFRSSSTSFLLGYDFATRHINDSGSANIHTLSTGIRYFLTKQLYLDARTGISMVADFNGSHSSKPNISIALTNDFNEKDSASLSFRKTSLPSSYMADIFDSWRVTLSTARQLLERLRMTLSIFFGEGDFEAESINDKQTGVNAQLSYDARKDVVAFLGFTYSDVDSNIDTRSYNRNLIEWGIRLSF